MRIADIDGLLIPYFTARPAIVHLPVAYDFRACRTFAVVIFDA
ncbi:hypothetical protein [Streptomyces sp. CC53]|nr:hypothetical protein [Streptomyces sp. CC53]